MALEKAKASLRAVVRTEFVPSPETLKEIWESGTQSAAKWEQELNQHYVQNPAAFVRQMVLEGQVELDIRVEDWVEGEGPAVEEPAPRNLLDPIEWTPERIAVIEELIAEAKAKGAA